MQRIFLTIVFLLLSGTFACSQSARHVVLISIDGFRPEFYRDTIQDIAPVIVRLLGIDMEFQDGKLCKDILKE